MKKVLLLIAFFVVSCKNDEINHPNILFIMSDDHTSQSWGIYGGILKDYVKNDGIKRLAKSGVVLENLFCTNAICVPSRASILTGQYSHLNGVYNLPDALDPDSLNVAKVLKNNGYQTSIVGKWHLKKEPSGFDYYKVLPGQGLYNDPKKVESPLIGKEFPKFKLNDLFLNTAHDNDSFQDKKTIINVWASWCLECEREHSHLIALSNNKNFDLVGINYKDNADDAKGWLNMRGNPYRIIIADFSGDLSLDLGVYGVPETYIIDKNQVILYKHIGPINNKIIQQEMMPLLGMNE